MTFSSAFPLSLGHKNQSQTTSPGGKKRIENQNNSSNIMNEFQMDKLLFKDCCAFEKNRLTSNSSLIYCHEPLAQEIAQALPVLLTLYKLLI